MSAASLAPSLITVGVQPAARYLPRTVRVFPDRRRAEMPGGTGAEELQGQSGVRVASGQRRRDHPSESAALQVALAGYKRDDAAEHAR
jgi:hypothetical protein